MNIEWQILSVGSYLLRPAQSLMTSSLEDAAVPYNCNTLVGLFTVSPYSTAVKKLAPGSIFGLFPRSLDWVIGTEDNLTTTWGQG